MDLTQSLARIFSAQVGPAHAANAFVPDFPLVGKIPGLGSPAVVGIRAKVVDETGVSIPDDKVPADVFVTYCALEDFVGDQLEATA
jgi:hypothetical protein